MGGKKDGAQLGRNLLKSKAQTKKGRRVAQQEGYLHTTDMQDGYDWGRLNLQSVTEQDTYTDFMNTAEMAGRDFDAEKWNVKLLDAQTRQVYIDTGGEEKAGPTPEQMKLRVPRRPSWQGLSPEQLKEEENKNFLDWRRELALLQEETGAVVTPYEKNLEFWRQLWRVIERSDVVIQIVDSRHPLLFRCPDLEMYVKEVSPLKKNLLLINKADLLTAEQREAWSSFLTKQGLDFAFFSALEEEEVEAAVEEEEGEAAGQVNEESLSEGEEENDMTEEEENTIEDEGSDSGGEPAGKTDILTCKQLVSLFRSYKRHASEPITVGFTGYPNVGKSSTINKLLAAKKVRVSETPGKTKHFQTLVLEDDVTLCDCPGLVMPSMVNSKAGMVLQGILPIDQLRDHVPCINLMIEHVPVHVLEAKYGLVLQQDSQLTCEQLLGAYGVLRGFMTSGGRPDQARAARLLLKDYVGGRLLYCEAPPGLDQAAYHTHPREVRRVFKDEKEKELEARRLQHIRKTKEEEINAETFATMSLGAHVRGKAKLEGRLSDKKKRKTKARNLYEHLDPKRHGHV